MRVKVRVRVRVRDGSGPCRRLATPLTVVARAWASKSGSACSVSAASGLSIFGAFCSRCRSLGSRANLLNVLHERRRPRSQKRAVEAY